MVRYTAVKGMNDILPPESFRWSRMEEDLRLIATRLNYEEIRTPIVETLELFQRGLGETSDVVQKEMYVFEDKNGNKLALRPEGTAGVVRAFIEHSIGIERPGPHKFFYIGPNFRYERPQKGRYRQFHQIGFEIFGDPSPEMDAELIYAAALILDHFRVKGEIRVNSIGCSICRPLYREKLIAYFRPKVDELCGDCRRRLELNPLRLLDCKTDAPRERWNDIPLITNHLCSHCVSDFESLQKALGIFHVPFIVDPFIVRGLDYYVKTSFEVTAETGGTQNAIAGGGRYDALVAAAGGQATPATGFAIGLERLLSVIPADFFSVQPLAMGFALFPGALPDLLLFTKHLSHHPVRYMAEYTPRKFKNALQKANKRRARHLFIFGEDEVKNRQVLYKDLATGEQRLFGQHETMTIVAMLMDKEIPAAENIR